MPGPLLKVNPDVYLATGARVMIKGAELLQDTGLHKSHALEDHILDAPRWGELHTFLEGKPEFAIEIHLPRALRECPELMGLTREAGTALNAKLLDYQWSKTPDVWNKYLQCRRYASRIPKDGNLYGDPTEVITGFAASLKGLLDLPEVQNVSSLGSMRGHLEMVDALVQRCAGLPAQLTWREGWRSFWNSKSPAREKEQSRAKGIGAISDDLKVASLGMQPDLIRFGLEYRELYLTWAMNSSKGTSAGEVGPSGLIALNLHTDRVAGALTRLDEAAPQLRNLADPERLDEFDGTCKTLRDKISSSTGKINLTGAEFCLYQAFERFSAATDVVSGLVRKI